MRTTTLGLALVALLATAAAACTDAPAAGDPSAVGATTSAAPAAAAEFHPITLYVPNMACPLCARTIEHRLKESGLRDIRIDLQEKRVTARFDPERLTPEEVKALVTDLGYTVAGIRVG